MIVLNHRVREQLPAKLVQPLLHFSAVSIYLDLKIFSDPHAPDLRHSEMLHCFFHGRSLRVKDRGLRCNDNPRFHAANLGAQGAADNDVLVGKNSFQADPASLVVIHSMEQPQPTPPPPAPVSFPPPRQGLGCFAKGCLTLVIAGFVFLVICIFGGWFVLNRLINKYTSTEPARIEATQPTPAESQAAEAKWNALRTAIRNNQETSVEFTATDINALIANDPDFRDARGHVHVDIANSIVSLDLSAPLESMKWRAARDRWFNGNIRFGMTFIDDDFSFELKSAEANGYHLPSILFTSDFERSFNRSFNERFRSSSVKHRERNDDFRHIRSVSVQDDKVIVTTRQL